MKTYPLVLEDEQHRQISKASEKCGLTIKDFIFNAINEKIERS